MKILLARFRSGRDFLHHYDTEFATGALLVPTRTVVPVEASVVVEVAFPGLPNHLLLRARAVDRDEDRGGLLVRFVASESEKRSFLLQCATGAVRPIWQRRHRRLPVRLPAEFSVDGGGATVPALAEDLSVGGIFLRTPFTLSARTLLMLRIQPSDGSATISVRGRVAWVRHHPPTSGFGVAWDGRTGREMKRLRQLIRVAKARGRVFEPGIASASASGVIAN
jgi:hypothetical protein